MRDVLESPTMEPVCDLVKRVDDFIKSHASKDENLLVVTHGAVTRIYADNAKRYNNYEITAPFLLNCHLVVYEYDGCDAYLCGYNDQLSFSKMFKKIYGVTPKSVIEISE